MENQLRQHVSCRDEEGRKFIYPDAFLMGFLEVK